MSISLSQIRERLVEVAARPADGKGYDLATGYAVSSDLILTVRHGLVRHGPPSEVQVRFIGSSWESVTPVFNADTAPDADFDAALLRLHTWRDFSSRFTWGLGDYRQAGRISCLSCGFPGLGQTTGKNLRITSESMGVAAFLDPLGGLKTDRFQLTLDAGAPEPHMWKGLSGGPVFVEGALIAIILSAMQSGRHLWATPVRRLADHAEFKALAGMSEELRSDEPSPRAPPPKNAPSMVVESKPEPASYRHVDPKTLRSERRQDLSESEFRKMLVGYGFYDKGHHPEGSGLPHDYEVIDAFDESLVFDRTTGLMWMTDVLPDVSPKAISDRIEGLNEIDHGGFGDWRLPTLEEAMSLLHPPRRNTYLDPVFHAPKAWIWTADSDGSHPWIVQTQYGNATLHPCTGVGIRAVRRVWPEDTWTRNDTSVSRVVLRSTVIEGLTWETVQVAVETYGLFVTKGKRVEPRTFGRLTVFERNGQGLVVDPGTGLMWQQSGSKQNLPHPKAKGYVGGLNRKTYGGFDDWRLPTVEEALSLLRPHRVGTLHVDIAFEETQSSIWTGDCDPQGRPWVVSFKSASASPDWSIFEQFVRGVRTVDPESPGVSPS